MIKTICILWLELVGLALVIAALSRLVKTVRAALYGPNQKAARDDLFWVAFFIAFLMTLFSIVYLGVTRRGWAESAPLVEKVE